MTSLVSIVPCFLNIFQHFLILSQVAPSLLPASLLPAHSSLPCSTTSLGSISAAVTKQEEEVAWRERGAEDTSEEEEDSEDCEDEEDEEESDDEEEDGWGCPNCGRQLAHPQWRCSNHSSPSSAFDGHSAAQNSSLPIEEPPTNLTAEEEISCCQQGVVGCHNNCGCHMQRHCLCCHHQLLHREAHRTRMCLESRQVVQNEECCSLME